MLVAVSVVLALIVAVPIGVYQAVRRNGPVDYTLTSLSFCCYSAPTFFVGTRADHWCSRSSCISSRPRRRRAAWSAILTDRRGLVLPVVTLALVTIAVFSRYMRSSVLDNLTEDYVRTARAKGLPRAAGRCGGTCCATRCSRSSPCSACRCR